MSGLGGALAACLSGDAYDGPSLEEIEVTRLRRELMDVPKLSDLVARALQPIGEPWHSAGLSPAALHQALDSEGDVRTAIVDAVVRSARSRLPRAPLGRPRVSVGSPTPLESLKLGGLWQRAAALGLGHEALSGVLDSPNPPRERLKQLADLIRGTESTRAAVAAEQARASAARRRAAHELVWGDSEDEEECDMEMWFPCAAVVGPAEAGHSVRIVRGNDEEAAGLDAMQRERAGLRGLVVQVDGTENRVKIEFRTDDGYGAYWRIMSSGAVYENHDVRSAVIGYHQPGAFVKRCRNDPNLAARGDPDFVRTSPGDDRHLSRQDGYVVVIQEHIDIDDALWVLTRTAPPGASRGGWMLTQSLTNTPPPSPVACCGSRPLRAGRGAGHGKLLEMVETSRRTHALKIEACGEPDVDGTYRRRHEASCRQHFVNENGMHLYYVPARQEWHIGSRHFGNRFDNLVIKGRDNEPFQLSGRHGWCRGQVCEDRDDSEGDSEGEGEGDGARDADENRSLRAGELVVKVMSSPEYHCS